MLTHLYIRDYTIVDELSLDILPKMTAITGETGAGKSLVFDALDLCLGARADSQCIRANQERCDITASFDIQHNPAAQHWLAEHELSAGEDECILRRTVSADGRSRSFVNGKPAPLQLTRELGNRLVNIHGQHEHQSLLKRDAQRDMLDTFAQHPKLLLAVKETYLHARALQKELHDCLNQENNPAQRELIRYQVNELQALNLQEGELEKLEQEHKVLSHADDTLLRCQRTISLLASDDTQDVQSALYLAINTLEGANASAETFKNVLALLQQASIQIDEALPELQSHIDHFEADPARLAEVEQRLAILHDVARKHHVKPAALIELQTQLETNLAAIDNSEVHIQKLEKALQASLSDYQIAAQKLTRSRQAAALRLSQAVTANIQELGLQGGAFSIQLSAINPEEPRQLGNDAIEFLVSTNPGQPLRALQKVASGGELSRIALAIQVITANQEQQPCLLFDEVDVGIGGATAHTVGQLLRKLGEQTQVICVTHLAQVAAYAHHHLLAEKQQGEHETRAQMISLNNHSRIDELARMMGAKSITEQSRKHAQELLDGVC